MIVYHGTGKWSLKGLLEEGPKLWPRAYLRGRKAFSTTTDFDIAALFAVRRSPPAALHDERELGVVLEYEVRSTKGWVRAEDVGMLQDEKEIAILNPGVLIPMAVWAMKKGTWTRKAI
jgi:hypothetical protein